MPEDNRDVAQQGQVGAQEFGAITATTTTIIVPEGRGDPQLIGAGFVRCLPNGCVAEVVMDEKLLGQLRGAKTATFIIFETPEEGIGFPLSLNGLGEGYDKLP